MSLSELRANEMKITVIILVIFFSLSRELEIFERDQILDLIESANYEGQVHQVTTEDGYILKIHRIIPKTPNGLKPVFLAHGILATAADFLITGPQIALAYLLSDYGYDVWLGNFNFCTSQLVKSLIAF